MIEHDRARSGRSSDLDTWVGGDQVGPDLIAYEFINIILHVLDQVP